MTEKQRSAATRTEARLSSSPAERDGMVTAPPGMDEPLAARMEPFDSYWQAPEDVEAGYRTFAQYYKANFLPHLPEDRRSSILVVSCGPGYLVNLLAEHRYEAVLGIDSDEHKIAHANRRGLNCRTARAFEQLRDEVKAYDAIVCEQELNHLTHREMLRFLRLCHQALKPGGTLLVYGLNGANPLVGAENLAHNIDHFNTFTEHSLGQVLELTGFQNIQVRPLKLYVFWRHPANYLGWLVTTCFETACRMGFLLYGKKVKVLSKKIAATARRPETD